MINENNDKPVLYSNCFNNLILVKTIDLNIGKSITNKGNDLFLTNPSNITILSKQCSQKLSFKEKSYFSEQLTLSVVSQINLISEKTKNCKTIESSEKLRIPKRSLSSVENIYCIKADEINKPVFFSKENNKELNNNKDKPKSSEMLTSEASHDESLIMFPNLVINDNMSDHLGKNAQIEGYFE
jgi:hypothetical protein